jgi:hypothetical protein
LYLLNLLLLPASFRHHSNDTICFTTLIIGHWAVHVLTP